MTKKKKSHKNDKYELNFRKPGLYARVFVDDNYVYRFLEGVDSVVCVLPITREAMEVNIEDYAMNVRALQSTLVVLPRSGNSVDIRTEAAYREKI